MAQEPTRLQPTKTWLGILALMLGLAVFAALLLPTQGSDLVGQLNEAAKKRDVATLQKLIEPADAKAHLNVVRSGGAYGTGRFGWEVLPLNSPDGERFAVLTTYLTSQDVGDMVFEIRDGKVARYLDERMSGGWRILKQAVDLKFDLPRKRAMLENTIDVQIPGRTDRPLILRLSPHYKVTKLSSKGKAMRYVQAGGCILVPDAANQTGTIPLTLNYEGVVDKPTYAGGIMETEASLTNDYWMPMVGRQPNPFTLRITSPKDWVAIGQGDLVGEKVVGESRVTQYKMNLPVVYTSVSIGKYKVKRQEIGGRTYTVWAADMTDQEMEDQIRFMEPVHRYYREAFEVEPFKGYGALISKPYGGGALEAYSFATYGEGWLPDEDAHEPAHTWFGGYLNNTYLNSFWNESFAVYSEGLYSRNAPIGNKADRAKAFVRTPEMTGADDVAPLVASGAFIGGGASSLGYGKGAYVLQMLESEAGTPAMLKAIRTWLKDHPREQAAEWEDFEAVFLQQNGDGFKPFFDDWMRKPGRLEFTISDVAYANGAVTGKIAHSRAKHFANAEVDLVMADGSVRQARIDLRQDSFRIPVAEKPKLVSVDPRRILYRRAAREEAMVNLESAMRTMRRFQAEPSFKMPELRARNVSERPADLNNIILVAHPDRDAQAKELCAKAGFQVSGNQLTYKGTTIDLTKGAAFAMVDLADGRRAVIALGNCRYAPQFGRARLVLVDELGRFLRGETDVRRSGPLTFAL